MDQIASIERTVSPSDSGGCKAYRTSQNRFNEMYNILIWMKMHRYSHMVFFYKKYKCSYSYIHDSNIRQAHL